MAGRIACCVRALALAWLGVVLPVAAADVQGPLKAFDQGASKDGQAHGSRVRRTTLRELSGLDALILRGTDGSATVAFGGRADELVTRAVLRLRYSHSPSLIFAQSHLRVLLNGESAEIIPLRKETSTGANEQVIELDPRFIGDLNRLRFQFVGHYTTQCEDLLHSSLWAEVSGASELELTSQPITVPSDLALLPEPFFDRRDLQRLRLPFVLPREPSLGIVHAAGVAASWFGRLAAWRGARFPVSVGEAVRGHAVVFATNSSRPDFLPPLAPIEGPTLRIVQNPVDSYAKLLLVLGRDEADLRIAVHGLVNASGVLSATEARVSGVDPGASRAAYDAPRWVRSDRPTRLGELVASLSELQAQGHSPARIRVGLRIPPDLFPWRSSGVPLDLKFRHNALATSSGGVSRLTVGVNGELLHSFELVPGDTRDASKRIRVPFLAPGARGAHSDAAKFPAFALGGDNELHFAFNFAVPAEGGCRSSYVHNIGGSIDPDSTIDFSSLPHYAALPELGYFATSGFPFTRYADLSQTIVIMPSAPDANEIETFITLMGRMGESTGANGTAVRLLPPGDTGQYVDADLLLIGTAARNTLLAEWQAHLPALVEGAARRLDLLSADLHASASALLGPWPLSASDSGPTTRTTIEGTGPVAALIGFESPVTPKRSVVVVTADVSESLRGVLDSLDDAGLVRAMHGSSVFVHSKRVESFRIGRTYSVGELPVWTWLWYHTKDHPIAVAFTGLVASLLFAMVGWWGLRNTARRRLNGAT